ncbi:MAG: type II toxin-antitoxin system HicA family toxin [Deltaproteobacteria bacterium]|nr:type II toxin-antitoxin system HicA family toxin [Deltaproteobacteria bacterium]
MRYGELTRKLRRLGCHLDRRARGDHEIWIRSSNGRRTTIPNWGSHELKTGTVRAILRDLGITLQDFDRA